MEIVVNTEKEWLELRKKYITASSASTLVGLNPYSSPKKIKSPDKFVGNAYTFIGHLLEPVVVDMTNIVMDMDFRLYEQQKDQKVFFTAGKLGATPDAHDGKYLLECKTTNPKSYLKYSASPPLTYLTQLQVQMMCTGIKEGYLAIMSTDLSQTSPNIIWPITVYKAVQNDKFCAILKEEVKRFLENDKFRVNSKVKKQCKILLNLCYEKVY